MHIGCRVRNPRREVRRSSMNREEDIEGNVMEDLKEGVEVKLFVTIVDNLDTWPRIVNYFHEFILATARPRIM